MPTPKQIEKLKNIKNPLIRRKYAQLIQLPQDLQDAMFVIETADKVYQVAQDNKLSSEQLWQFSYIIGMIFLGDLHITEFIKKLQDKCGLSYEKARAVAQQTNLEIFLPLKESLKLVHKIPRWPREEETAPSAPSEPSTAPSPAPAVPAPTSTPLQPQLQKPPVYQRPGQVPTSLQERLRQEQEKRMINLKK